MQLAQHWSMAHISEAAARMCSRLASTGTAELPWVVVCVAVYCSVLQCVEYCTLLQSLLFWSGTAWATNGPTCV